MKPAHEPIMVARKPLVNTVAQNVLQYGTGALNIDACRVKGIPPSVPQPSFNSLTGQIYGMKTGDGRNGEMSQSSMGRWAPNILLTHSPECVPAGVREVRNRSGSISPDVPSEPVNDVYRARGRVSWRAHGDGGVEAVQAWDCAGDCPVAELDRQSGGSVSRAGKPRKSAVPGEGYGMTHTGAEYSDAGGASRFYPCFKYQAKAGKKERPSVDGVQSHPTVKPLELIRWLVRLVTPPGGIVLDPFAGTGTTGEACRLEGFKYVLIEREDGYVRLIRERMSGPASLFDDWNV